MSRHHCKTCGNPLHADDTHAECVSRLGKCSHCECFSLASLRSWLAFFSESDSIPRALQFSSSKESVRKKQRAEDLSGRWQASSRRVNAHVPRRHCRGESIRPSSSLNMISIPLLWGTWSHSVRVSFMAASDAEGVIRLCDWPHPLTVADEDLIRIMTKAVNELGLEWSPLRSHPVGGTPYG